MEACIEEKVNEVLTGDGGTVDDGEGQDSVAEAAETKNVEDEITSEEPEVEPLRMQPNPTLPTQIEIDAHYVDRIHFRSWCRHCMEGFGREDDSVAGLNDPLNSGEVVLFTFSVA